MDRLSVALDFVQSVHVPASGGERQRVNKCHFGLLWRIWYEFGGGWLGLGKFDLFDW